MDTQRIVLLSSAIVGIVAAFLPWYHAPLVGAILGTGDRGWLTLCIFIVPLFVALAAKRTKPLLISAQVIAGAACAMATAVAVHRIVEFESMRGNLSNELGGAAGPWGSGLLSDQKSEPAFGELMQSLESVLSMTLQVGIGLYATAVAGLGGIVAVLLPPTRRTSPDRDTSKPADVTEEPVDAPDDVDDHGAASSEPPTGPR